jgi:hypothetical protein
MEGHEAKPQLQSSISTKYSSEILDKAGRELLLPEV